VGESESLLAEHRGSALWLTMNRPQAMNSLTVGMMIRLKEEMDAAAANPAVRVVVLTGSGRAFCAGADLRSFGADDDSDRPAIARFMEIAEPASAAVRAFPGPTIAAVNGLALAGGLEIALNFDFIIAAETARIGDAHLNFGLIPGGGNTARLPRRVGLQLAKYMIYSGRQFDAATMKQAGLVLEVHPDDQLVAGVDAIVDKLAAKSPLAIARAKQLISTAWELTEEEGMEREATLAIEHSQSADAAEGLAAFAEKRKPNFIGR